MKYIFDFDDVIFHTTKYRRERIFTLIEQAGISNEKIEEYYKIARLNCFSLKNMLDHFELPVSLYQKIISESKSFVNTEILKFILKLDKNDKYIVTYGDKKFNMEKLSHSGVFDLFLPQNIFIVQGSKKKIIESICVRHKKEKVIFIDDKEKEFIDLDLNKYPNLKTILYTGQKLDVQDDY